MLPSSTVAGDSTELLRRLDWRFLLPSSTLGHVLLLGRRSGTLDAALHRFASSVTSYSDLAATAARSDEPQFDLAVLESPSSALLEQSFTVLKPAGCVYVEVIGDGSRLKGALSRTGFVHISFYWVRPDPENCVELISLSDIHPLAHVLARRGLKTFSRTGASLLRMLLLSRWSRFTGSHLCAIAQRS
jgi:hypothetical protein